MSAFKFSALFIILFDVLHLYEILLSLPSVNIILHFLNDRKWRRKSNIAEVKKSKLKRWRESAFLDGIYRTSARLKLNTWFFSFPFFINCAGSLDTMNQSNSRGAGEGLRDEMGTDSRYTRGHRPSETPGDCINRLWGNLEGFAVYVIPQTIPMQFLVNGTAF